MACNMINKVIIKVLYIKEFPGCPVVKDSGLSLLWAQVLSLVGELKSPPAAGQLSPHTAVKTQYSISSPPFIYIL